MDNWQKRLGVRPQPLPADAGREPLAGGALRAAYGVPPANGFACLPAACGVSQGPPVTLRLRPGRGAAFPFLASENGSWTYGAKSYRIGHPTTRKSRKAVLQERAKGKSGLGRRQKPYRRALGPKSGRARQKRRASLLRRPRAYSASLASPARFQSPRRASLGGTFANPSNAPSSSPRSNVGWPVLVSTRPARISRPAD